MSTRRRFVAGTLGGIAVWQSQKPLRAAPAHPLSSFDPVAGRLLAEMTLDEKIGQMAQPDQMFLKTPDDIEKYHLGSLLSGGDSDPKSGNDIVSWTDLVDSYMERSTRTRLKIPLLYGVDAVHGHNNIVGAVVFPHNIGLGCTRDAALVERIGRITALEVRATGINWAFAPCVTVPQDVRWGRTYEGYSEDPAVVKMLGGAATRGLQGKGLDDPLAVLACAKHFAGDGGTSARMVTAPDHPNDPPRMRLDQGDTEVSEDTLRRVHLQGYRSTIEAGVASIMPSYSSWNGVKLSGHKYLLTDVLKKEMGFQGFLISDYAAVDQLPEKSYPAKLAHSINAGMDMVMIPEKYVEFCAAMKALASSGQVPMSRIDDAVRRILRVKFAMGLMDSNRSVLADRNLQKDFGSEAHRAVAREAVRKSVVVLQNNGGVLPLAKGAARVHVAGKSADDIGNQCGGWTIRWQGQSGPVTSGGTTVLAAVRKALGNEKVTSSADGSGATGAAVGIAVIGETPYAEFMGDRSDLRLSREDVQVVANMKNAGLKVIAIVFSGRPVVIDEILETADAIVAAFLPGTEGDGIADVLLGDYRPTGKLSFTWPKGTSTSYHLGAAGYQMLFSFGHGLAV